MGFPMSPRPMKPILTLSPFLIPPDSVIMCVRAAPCTDDIFLSRSLAPLTCEFLFQKEFDHRLPTYKIGLSIMILGTRIFMYRLLRPKDGGQVSFSGRGLA